MNHLLALVFIACAFLGAYMILDALLPVDPDLAAPPPKWLSDSTCGIPGCAAHRRTGR